MVKQRFLTPSPLLDLNGLTLSYTADGLPDGLSIDPNSGIISGTVAPSGADGIPWQVTVDATDGVETSERTFQWTVLPSVIPALSLGIAKGIAKGDILLY